MKVGGGQSELETGFTIRLLKKGEAGAMAELVRLFGLVFEEAEHAAADEAYLGGLLAGPHFLAVAVFDSTKRIVGGLTAYVLPRYRPGADEAFIFDVAVHPDFQRRGLGLQLLRHFNQHCVGLGIRETFVPAAEKDRHALDFYRKAGGAEERVRLFVFDNWRGSE